MRRWLVSFVGIVAAISFYIWRKEAVRDIAHRIGHTRGDIAVIMNAAGKAALLDPGAIRPETVTNISSLYTILAATNNGICLLAFRSDWQSAGKFLDHWDNPMRTSTAYNVDASGKTNSIQLKVWSVGRNGLDEGRGGDDISESISLSLLK